MKRAIYAVFVIFILSIVAVLAAPSFIDVSVYKGQAIDAFKKQTGLELNLGGEVDIAFLPSPKFVAEDVTVLSAIKDQKSDIVSFERLNVNLSIMPLLQGKVSIQSVTLVKPIVTIEKKKDGTFNFSTPEILGEQVTGKEEKTQNRRTETATLPQISLDKIHIQDGVFSYKDHKTGQITEVRNINADLGAQSLTGPYWAQGSLFYDRSSIDFNIKTKKLDQENKVISSDIALELKPDGVQLNYAGVIGYGAGMSVQGHTTLNIASIKKSLSHYGGNETIRDNVPVLLKGLVTLENSEVNLKDINLKVGDQDIDVGASVSLSPLSYKISLKNTEGLNLSNIINGPVPFNKLVTNMNISGDAQGILLKSSSVKLDETALNLSGKYSFPDAHAKERAKLRVKISSEKVNYDNFVITPTENGEPIKAQTTSKTGHMIKESASNISLPIDVSLDLKVNELKYQEKSYKNVRVNGELNDNTMSLTEFSVKDYEGANISAKANITNVKLLSGITSYVTVDVTDVSRFATALSLDAKSLPPLIKTAKLKSKLEGNIREINLTANIEAAGGEVIAKGKLENILGQMKIEDLALQVKHKSVAKAVHTFTGVALDQRVFGKALNFYTKVNQSGTRYALGAIKANISGVEVQGDVDVNMSTDKPTVKGNLKFGTLALNSIMGARGSKSNRTGSGTSSRNVNSSAGRWSKVAIDTSALHAVNLDVIVSAKKIEYGQWPLISPALKLKLKDGHLKITDLNAGLFGGRITSTTDVKTVSKPRQPIYFESQSAFRNVDLGKLSNALIGTKLVKITGNGDMELNVKSSGSSPAALIHDLSGNGNVNGNKIILDGVDVKRFAKALSYDSKPGDTITGLWKGTTKGGTSKFETLGGVLNIKNGVVNIQKMDLDGAESSIITRGQVNLPKWTLSTKHTITVKPQDDIPSDIPPFDISINGSLDNPAQNMGQSLLNEYLNRKIQRKLNKILADQLGFPSNDNNTPQNEGDNKNNGSQGGNKKSDPVEDLAEKAIKGIIGDLLR
ncbi:MAG: AsmA family protein [Alphaproteobacteria bacterium]